MIASAAWRTPSLIVSDGCGLPMRQIAYLRTFAGDTAEVLVSRRQHDLNGEPLDVRSVDAGRRLTLPGLAGEALERWDERGNHWRSTQLRYDVAGQLNFNEAEEGLSSLKLAKIHSPLDELDAMVTRLTATTNTAFAELGINEFYDEQHAMRDYMIDLALNRVGTAKARTLRQSDAARIAANARDSVGGARDPLSLYQAKVPAIRNRYRGK
ncbi:hypothetical protein J3D48_002844 [Pseudomonas fluorescens]|uniref:hypothetical protein n=1 Tax=Pseudomonas fluorescens TaxID=294 RepID=UPI00209C7F26|nr:hypothetical protein [Pseudomonas fluorescens]MCP1486531.1 hypothetical protein [Pseudomonas fluorescens]